MASFAMEACLRTCSSASSASVASCGSTAFSCFRPIGCSAICAMHWSTFTWNAVSRGEVPCNLSFMLCSRTGINSLTAFSSTAATLQSFETVRLISACAAAFRTASSSSWSSCSSGIIPLRKAAFDFSFKLTVHAARLSAAFSLPTTSSDDSTGMMISSAPPSTAFSRPLWCDMACVRAISAMPCSCGSSSATRRKSSSTPPPSTRPATPAGPLPSSSIARSPCERTPARRSHTCVERTATESCSSMRSRPL
mmetsp:Transcript_5188/g.11269  ORF Transcript_5188/g.11269 Transcript_5188/m.11269 type:complete len:252 (+) Transcript_5188:497-1252(+)